MADDPNKGGSHQLKHQLPTGVDVSQFFPADKRDALHELEERQKHATHQATLSSRGRACELPRHSFPRMRD